MMDTEELRGLLNLSRQYHPDQDPNECIANSERKGSRRRLGFIAPDLADEVLRLRAVTAAPVSLAEAARVPEIAALIEAMPDLLDFIERHSNRWDGIIGKHPMEIHMAASAAFRAIAGEPK